MNQTESNEKILEQMNKEYDLSKKEIELFKELILKCDLKIQNKDELTPLMYALEYNKNQNLNLSEKQWDYLIQNSDLKQKDNWGWTPLMYVLSNNKSENLNEEQIDYLIKNSDLKQQDNIGKTILFLALVNNKTQNLEFIKQHFQRIYDALDEKQKEITFKNIIQEHVNNNHQYLEEINLFLYNLQFQPHEKTIHWLKENQHQDILEMIEKRDLFFQLNKDLKEINHHQKIAIIKL